MWDCPECGCQAIAASLTRCPMCDTEVDMGAISRLGGPTNYGEPRPGPAPEVTEEPAPEVTEEPVPDGPPVAQAEGKAASTPPPADGKTSKR